MAQVEFHGGVPKDTGPNSYTLTPTGTPTYVEVDNPDPNAITLPRALYGRRDESSPLRAYPKRLVIDPATLNSTPFSNITSNQVYVELHDPYNPAGYIEIGHIGAHELLTPTHGRIRSQPASRVNEMGKVNRTPGGIAWSPRENRPSGFNFKLSSFMGDEGEQLLAELVRNKSNTAIPILVIDRSRPSQPLIDRCFWGPCSARGGLQDPGPDWEEMDVSVVNQEDYGNG